MKLNVEVTYAFMGTYCTFVLENPQGWTLVVKTMDAELLDKITALMPEIASVSLAARTAQNEANEPSHDEVLEADLSPGSAHETYKNVNDQVVTAIEAYWQRTHPTSPQPDVAAVS